LSTRARKLYRPAGSHCSAGYSDTSDGSSIDTIRGAGSSASNDLPASTAAPKVSYDATTPTRSRAGASFTVACAIMPVTP
jgi:hypothetical protein